MEQAPLPVFKSSVIRAFQDVVSTPNWVANVLWLSLAALASSVFIGQIGLFGYGAELLQRRSGRPENPSVDIDSERLGDYISKGVWPFLVCLIVQFVTTCLLLVPIGVFIGLAVLAASAGDDGRNLVFGVIVVMAPIVLILSVASYLIATPFLIRGMVCQDFKKSFDLAWILDFARVMAMEMIVSGIVYGLLSGLIMLAGSLVFCVGQIPASGIVLGGYVNLLAQWYEIYLSKGGIAVPPPEDQQVVEATLV